MEIAFPISMVSTAATQFLLVFSRTAAITFFLPGIGESYVSPRIKLAVALGIALLVFPIIGPDININSNNQRQVFSLLISETITGLFWGAIIRLVVFCLQIAGSIISQATSLAQIFGGTANMDAQPAMGHILVVSGVALICIVGLHETYLTYIINTYKITPVGPLIPASDVAKFSSHLVARTFALAFQLAAAALVATLLYNVILGVINRAMPQLLVSFVGAPAITAGGLLILYLMAPTIMDVWLDFVADIIVIPEVY